MKVLVLLVIGFFGSVFSYGDDIVSESNRYYIVEFIDGVSEKWVIKYRGHTKLTQWQTGEHSSWKHPFDTRQCHWEFVAYVERDACIVSHSGQEFCQGDFSRIYHLQNTGEGKHYNWKKLQGDNCGKMQPKISTDYKNVQNMLKREFDNILKDDFPKILNKLKGISGFSKLHEYLY